MLQNGFHRTLSNIQDGVSCKIVNIFQSIIIFTKSSILDVWQSSGYTSVYVDSGFALSDGKKSSRYVVNDSHSVLRYVSNKRSLIFRFVYGQIPSAVNIMNFDETRMPIPFL